MILRIDRLTPQGADLLIHREAVLTYYPAEPGQAAFYIFDHPLGSVVLPEQAGASPLYHLYLALQQHVETHDEKK